MGFKIPSLPQTEQKTIRFPISIIEKVEELTQGTKCSFSAFVVASVENAIKDLENK